MLRKILLPVFLLLLPFLFDTETYAQTCVGTRLVDIHCFVTWRDAFGRTPSAAGTDFNQDGKVSLRDFEFWRRARSRTGSFPTPLPETPLAGQTVQVPSVPQTHPPTPTGQASRAAGACGEPMDVWHAPVVNGCQTGHEHGDPPPDWIAAAGFESKFHGHYNTSVIENTVKHTSMKGFHTTLNGTEIYFRLHFASNPQERFGTYHSYEVFSRDPSGSVSHWQGWTYTGKPTDADDRCLRRSPALSCEGVRPIILVTDQTSLSQGITCEQWYGTGGGGWTWDFGWTICGSTTVYQREKEQDSATAFDLSTWQLTGNKGLFRRLEAAWYGPDSRVAPNRGNPPKYVRFWSTQFGELVSGPNDPRCSRTTVGKDGITYQNICLDQFIAGTAQAVEFPGNAAQKNYDGTGVTVPN